jgi:hypothetical protein
MGDWKENSKVAIIISCQSGSMALTIKNEILREVGWRRVIFLAHLSLWFGFHTYHISLLVIRTISHKGLPCMHIHANHVVE